MHDVRLCFEMEEESSYDPVRMLFLFVLDRALRDLQSDDRQERRNAKKWFEGTKSLLPRAIGYRDILDLDFLPPRVLLEIRNRVWAAGTEKVAA